MPELCRLALVFMRKKVQAHHVSFTLPPCVNMMDNNCKTQWVKKNPNFCEPETYPCGLILVKLKPLAHYRTITDFIIS